MQSGLTESPINLDDKSNLLLLEFDRLIAFPDCSLEELRVHINSLVETVDKESTLVAVIRLLESDRAAPPVPSTNTDARSDCDDDLLRSPSSIGTKLSLNGDSRSLLNDVLPCSVTTRGIDALSPLPQRDGENKGEDDDEVDDDDNNDGLNHDNTGKPKEEGGVVGVKLQQSKFECQDVSPIIFARRAAVSAESLPLNVIQSYTPPSVTKSQSEEQVVRSVVAACHLFSNMDSRDRGTIVRALRQETYSAGTDILKQAGASLEKLFLITQGTCEVIKNGRLVHTLHVGSTFGEMEMMYQQPNCAATIRCVTNCTVYTLDQRTYQHIVLAVSLQKRKKYEELLLNVGLLKTFSNYDRMLIAEALVTRTYRQGDHIIRFGEPGKWMHIIVEGQVAVVGRHLGKKREILRLGEGHVVGELEFVFNHLAVADVVVLSRRVITAQIQRQHFELITGPIHDHLKEYVVNSGMYSHYLGEANERIKAELNLLGRRSKRMASKAERENTLLDQVDIAGEIILPAPREKVMILDGSIRAREENITTTTTTINNNNNADDNTTTTPASINVEGSGCDGGAVLPSSSAAHVLFRFPLTPLHANSLAMIGLREDGSILVWNPMMVRLTGYTAEEAVGQHIYSFLLDAKDQKTMHSAICDARHYTGDVEAFFEEKGVERRPTYTFARMDGLTKVRLRLTVMPSIVSHGKDAAEIMLAVGEEVYVSPQEVLDKSQLLIDQISGVLRDGGCSYEDRLHRVAMVLSSFDTTCRAMTASTENVRVVNIRQMIGQVIMDYGAQCVANGVAVRQRFEGLYAENAYLNAVSLPECLRYAMSNCTHHLDDVQVTITVSITEINGLEFLVIEFHDNGPGFPKDLLCDFQQGRASEKYPQVHRVRVAMERQGGSMFLESVPGDTRVRFAVPFVPMRDGADGADGVVERGIDDFDASRSLSGMSSFAHGSFTTTVTNNTTTPSCATLQAGGARLPVARHTFTTLVVEDTPAHRNMLCSFLWERKHAVLPAYNLEDIEQLIEVADILFIDPHQSIFRDNNSLVDPITLLREKARRLAVVITGCEMDETSGKAYHTAGFITLKKPCTPIQALQCIRKAEEMISQCKVEAERIIQTRETLSKNSRGAWERGKLLGKGSFGAVYEATEVLTGGKMAVKEIRLGRHNLQIEQFVHEISTMCNLQHPNIIHYFYCEEKKEENVIRVFMEYAAGGTLQQLLQKKGKLVFKEYQSLLRDIVEGVAYIHSMRYVHGDLKTANVLLSAEGKGKIGDFGTARRVGEGELLYQMQGSPLYMSPECMAASDTDEDGVTIGYSFPSDIWSLGCIAFEMATNKPPFSHLKNIKGPMGLMSYITNLHDTPDLSPLFDGPPSIVEFVSACLNPDPSKRATAAELLHISIFSEATDEDMKSALRALKRAELLHVLNSFVAFEEPETGMRRSSLVRRRCIPRHETGFFDSTQDSDWQEDREEEEYENEADARPKGVSTVCVPALEGASLASSIVQPLPRRRSRTKSKSHTRSPLRVDEDAFFASSLSSSSGLEKVVEGKRDGDSANFTCRGADSSNDDDGEEKKDTLSVVDTAAAAATTTVAATAEKSAGWNEHNPSGPSVLARRHEMASFINCAAASTVANMSIAFMGRSIDNMRGGANSDVLTCVDQQQPMRRRSYREDHSLVAESSCSGELGQQVLSSSKALTYRQHKRGMKNMFSVEELDVAPREKSPEANFPPTRVSSMIPFATGIRHSYRSQRRFAVAPEPTSPSPSPAVEESSGLRPSSHTSGDADILSPSLSSMLTHRGTGSCTGGGSGSGSGSGAQAEVTVLQNSLLELMERLKREEAHVGAAGFCRGAVRRGAAVPHQLESGKMVVVHADTEANTSDTLVLIRELVALLERHIVEFSFLYIFRMALVYHRWYDTDLTHVGAVSGGFREVRMSWSLTDPQADETTIVALLTASATSPEAVRSGEGTPYALRVTLFAKVSAVGDPPTQRQQEEHVEEKICSAAFEIHGPLEPSVLRGTSGVVFLSTRQFVFSATAPGTEGKRALDRFFFSEEWQWERQHGVVSPLDAEPICRLFAEVTDNSWPRLLLITRISSSASLPPAAENDVVDMLVVVCKEEKIVNKGLQAKRRATSAVLKKADVSVSSSASTGSLYTFVVAVLRCSMGHTRVAVAEWELLHLFVDRGVPFQQYVSEVKTRSEMWTIGGAKVPSTNAAVVDPSQCSWFFLRHSCTERAMGCGDKKDKNVLRGGGGGGGVDGGIIVALVPQPSETVTVVCGGFDVDSHSYRLGIVAGQAGWNSGAPPREAEENDNPEETLWSLAEDTHTVQMMLLGTPIESVHGAEKANAPGISISSGNSGWRMQQVGLTMVLRLVVDFIDDGMKIVGRADNDDVGSGTGGRRRQQGLYAAACAPLERNRRGRFPLPRAVCWLDAVPLPIGRATTSALLFSDDNDNNTNSGGDDSNKNNWMQAYSSTHAATGVPMDEEDATSWYHLLPTSLASTFPLRAGNGALRCFVSVNPLLKKTRLTYVLEMNRATDMVLSDVNHHHHHQQQQQQHGKTPLQMQASDLMYARPKRGGKIEENNKGDNVDGDEEEEEENAFMAAYMARAAAMGECGRNVVDTSGDVAALHDPLLDWVSPEAVMYEAWWSVALGRHASTAASVLDAVAQGVEMDDIQSDVLLLANSIRRFLLAFLIELDLMTRSDNDILRGVVLLMLGLMETAGREPNRCRGAFVRGGNSLVQLLTPDEMRGMHLLLKRSSRWNLLAASLFAWVNQHLAGEETQATLLEDVVHAWEEEEEEKEEEEKRKAEGCDTVTGSGSPLEGVLWQLRVSQDPFVYQNSVFALACGNISMRDVASLACWRSPPVGEPSILLLQLLVDVSVACENTAASFISPAEVSRLAASVVHGRLPQSRVSPAVMIDLLRGWNFGFLEAWPLASTHGALQVVYLLLHLSAIDAAEAGGDTTGSIKEDSRTRQFVAEAVRVLCWLCGDSAERGAEVLDALRRAKVPLMALCFSENVATHCTSRPLVSLFNNNNNNSSGVRINHHGENIGTSGSGVGVSCCSRALHHILGSPTASILSAALSAPADSSSSFVDKGASEKLALTLWNLVLEGDEAAAFNPILLQQLHKSFRARREATSHATSRLTPLLLLEFLRPVFFSTLPRILAALVDQRETVGSALAVVSAAAGVVSLDPPLDGGESVSCVWLSTLREVGQLLRLHAEESLDVQCLSFLFSVFEESCAVALRRPSSSSSSSSSDKGVGSPDEGQLVFTFSPLEMYFVALQILSNDPARLVVVAEVMRRSLRRYLVDEVNRSPPQVDGVWKGIRAYLGDMMDKLELVVSAFEVTAPLYAQMLLLLFLDESAAFAETAAAAANEEMERVVSEVYDDMLRCVQGVAAAKWAKLHPQERSVLFRVLSDRLSLSGCEEAEDDAYGQSETHQQVCRDTARLQMKLQQRTIDAALLMAVGGTFVPEALELVPRGGDGKGDMIQGPSTDSTDLALLLKEEAYVRRQLQRQLLRECDEFRSDYVFRAALAVLYLALREEQRRRVFIVFAFEQKDIILAFSHLLHKMLRENCRNSARALRQAQLEGYQKRMQHLFLQERESRTAVDAVCSVELRALFNQALQHRALLEAETTLRDRHAEEEEMQRDALYELFAKEEVEMLRRHEARMEEEVWHREEELWAMEMQRQRVEGRAGDEDEGLGEENALLRGNHSKASASLQSQGYHLAATDENVPNLTATSAETKSMAAFSSQAAEDPKLTMMMMINEMKSPASALAPLLQMDSATGSDGGSGRRVLMESSDSLFGAFSRLQKQIVSTVAPPPPSLYGGGDAAASPVSLQQQRGRDERELGHRAFSPPQLPREEGTRWKDDARNMPALSTPRRHAAGANSSARGSPEKMSAAPDAAKGNIQRLESAASVKACCPPPHGRRRRRRLLGEVVNLDAALVESPCRDTAQQQQVSGVVAPMDSATLCVAESERTTHTPSDNADAADKSLLPNYHNDDDDDDDHDNHSQSKFGIRRCGTESKLSLPSRTLAETLHENSPTVKQGESIAVRVEEDLRLQSKPVSMLQGDEMADRFALSSEERLTRAFLSRSFLLLQQ